MFQRLANLIRPASIASAGTPVELPVTDTGDAAVCQTPGESTIMETIEDIGSENVNEEIDRCHTITEKRPDNI